MPEGLTDIKGTSAQHGPSPGPFDKLRGHPLPAPRGEGSRYKTLRPAKRGEGARRADEGPDCAEIP
jgi:hypothetical protein